MTRRRAFFYAQDAYGLGHIRRTLLLAGDLARRRPRAALLVASGSSKADELATAAGIPSLDVVRIPEVGRGALYAGLPPAPALGVRSGGIWPLRAAVLAAAGKGFAPHLVHVDQSPAGYGRELAAALADWRSRPDRPRLLLGLRDIPDEPWDPRAQWQRSGAELVDRAYDGILVYGDPRLYDVRAAYGFSDAAAAKTTFCGYLPPSPPTRDRGEVRAALGLTDEPLVVVTTGGGRDGAPLVRDALAALRDARLAGVAAIVVAGPLLDPAVAADLAGEADRLPNVLVVPFVTDLVDRLAAADVVVTRGGSAVCEAVWLGKRPIVVPRIHPDYPTSEQLVRAERFAALGLATLVPPAEATAARLARAIREELDAGVSPPPLLDFGGLDRAGAILAETLGE